MRTLAIGDVHGCLTALQTLLRLVAPVDGDHVIALGDYVDRGPDSKGVLDCLIELYDVGMLVPLCGNHDEMMLEARDGGDRRLWLSCGGRETLASYGHELYEKTYDRVPERHWRFLERECRDWFETDTHLFVHGSIDPELPMKDQEVWSLRWQKLSGQIRHRSGKTLVCGHTRQRDGLPLVYDRTVCIDTGAYDDEGWLTCVDVGTRRYYQANERGETRQGKLDDLRGRLRI
jgi:serine/threonine protein phosphatase 1